jgi:hypothetical protein
MKKSSLLFLAGAVALVLTSCSSSTPPAQNAAPPATPASKPAVAPAQTGTTPGGTPDNPLAIPNDIQELAMKSLGDETVVLAFGDLAKNGKQEILAANLLKTTPTGVAPGILFTRLVVLQKDGANWKEILRGDEHLKNDKGYLGGIPLAPINGWRLQMDQTDATKGLVMYFSPIVAPAGGHIKVLGVRWNTKVNRYQSLDPTYMQFEGEVQQLETPESQVKL